jgi:hypothetical protein
MDLAGAISQNDLISALCMRIQGKYPSNPQGYCAPMTDELCKELSKYGIKSRKVEGLFLLDGPYAGKFITHYDDEYEVPHDWLEHEGKVLDISAKMFRKYVDDQIPEIVYINHTSPLYNRYKHI